MRKFPKLLAAVLALAIVICPAMCLTSMADEPSGTYAFTQAITSGTEYDTATLTVSAENGFIVALAKVDLHGYTLAAEADDVDPVTTLSSDGEQLSADYSVSGSAVTVLIKHKDVDDMSLISSATVSFKVVKADADDHNHYLTLTHIQAADKGVEAEDGTIGDENLLTFPYANNNENGLIDQVTAAANNASVMAGVNCSHDRGDATVTTDPTCTESGEMTVTCADCGATWTETVDALGHDHQYVSISDTQHAMVCQNEGCDDVKDGTTADHTFGDDGFCTVCGHEREASSCEHKWGTPVIVQPTLTASGTKTYTCTNEGCSETLVETIDPISIDSNITATVSSGTSETIYLSYKVTKSVLINDKYDAFYLEINKQVKDSNWDLVDGEAQYIRSSDITDNTNRYIIATNSAYYFYFRNIQLYALSVPVKARFYAIKDGVTVAASEEIVVTPAKLIQEQYTSNVSKFTSTSIEKYKALATSLADILIAADECVKYQTRNKPNSDFANLTSPVCDFTTGDEIVFDYKSTELLNDLDTTDVAYTPVAGHENDITYRYSTGVSQSPYISAVISNYNGSIESYSVRFTYHNEVTDKDVVTLVSSSDMLVNSKGEYYAYCYDVAIYASNAPVKIEVLKNDTVIGEASCTLEAYYASNTKEALSPLLNALARLGQSFRNYKANF